MNARREIPPGPLRGPLLRSVSRSFYLSIRLLPARIRDPIALAYLLARATDTIADTTAIDAASRMENLRILAAAIQGTRLPDKLEPVRAAFAPHQTNSAERTLIEMLPACLSWLQTLAAADRADVRDVLQKINRGQSLDVERFGETNGVCALGTAADLDEYTYLVAGCVGEFWTAICFRHLRNFANLPPDEMAALGVRYGKGLQLVNILRDAGADLRHGRCYLPSEELAAHGMTPEEILRQPQKVEPILEKWRAEAGQGLRAGIDYACAIRSRRVRFATALPAIIGMRTLALLRHAGSQSFERAVKIPRGEVRAIMRKAALGFASPRVLRKLFAATENNSAASP